MKAKLESAYSFMLKYSKITVWRPISISVCMGRSLSYKVNSAYLGDLLVDCPGIEPEGETAPGLLSNLSS